MFSYYVRFLAHNSHASRLLSAVRAVALALLLLSGALSYGLAEPVGAAGATPADQPALPQPGLSQAVGHADVAYHARLAGDGVVARNPEQALDAAFDAEGLTVTAGGQTWGMRLTAYGYGDRLAGVPSGRPRAAANRVEIDRGPLSEWYLNGPWGLEQGFTLRTRPAGGAGSGMLTLRLAHTGSAATVDASGDAMTVALAGGGSLRYTGLTAVDASGRSLPAHLSVRHHGELEIRVDDAGATYPVVIDPFIQYAKLVPLTPDADGALGSAVAVNDEIVAVGGPGDDGVGTVYIFARTPGSWQIDTTPLIELIASDAAPGDYFGAAIAVDGDRLVIGAPYAAAGADAAGAVYVFERPPGQSWANLQEVGKLQAATPQNLMLFGGAVALHEDRVVVGAAGYDKPTPPANNAGTAYVFEPDGGGWSQAAVLNAPSPETGAYFGNSVACGDDAIIIGAPAPGLAKSGEAYVYVEDADEWTYAATLRPAAPAAANWFGQAVAIAGTTVLVGAPKAAADTTGAAYLFEVPAGGWLPADVVNETAILTGSDHRPDGLFGWSVALDASQALVGSTNGGLDETYAGAAYLFRKPVGGWVSAMESTKFVASDGVDNDSLGWAVALGGHLYVAGAPYATVGGKPGAGAAYAFSYGDLAIAKEVTPAFVFPGDAITYTLTFTNSGPLTALDVVITDTIPVDFLTDLSVDSTVAVTPRAGTTYVWDVADLAPGASGVIVVSGQVVSPLVPMSFDNTASISTSTLNANPDNDRSTAGVIVLGPDDAAIEGLTATNNSPKQIGQAVQFTATVSAGDNVNYIWNFGDGKKGSGANPTHRYTAKGTYLAMVTAVNGAGQVSRQTQVTIADVPIAGLSATNDGPTLLGTPTKFKATVAGGTNVTYAWDFGDGQNGTGSAPAHTYAAVGTYTAQVKASNSLGDVTAQTEVNVTQNAKLNIIVEGNGSVTKDPDLAEYAPNSVVTLTAIPAANTRFTGWSGAVIGAANPIHVTMDSSKTITAKFVDAQAPAPVNDVAATLQDTAINGNVLANDVDPEATPLTVITSTMPAHGTAAVFPDGQFRYKPDASFAGIDVFEYTVRNGFAKTSTAKVFVHVTRTSESSGKPHVVIGATGEDTSRSFTVNGLPYTVTVPAGAYEGELPERSVFYVVFTPLAGLEENALPPASLKFAGVVFRIQAFIDDTPLDKLGFASPLLVTLTYDPAVLGDADPTALVLRVWDTGAGGWSGDSINLIGQDVAAHQITFAINHLSDFALFIQGQRYHIYGAQLFGQGSGYRIYGVQLFKDGQ